jgi:sugar phosphate isomerase/epimerase
MSIFIFVYDAQKTEIQLILKFFVMTKRRDFIKTSAFLAAGSLMAPAFASINKTNAGKMQSGIQIYSVRNQLSKDFPGTMKQVAEIGYKLIEGYGLGLDGKFLGKISPQEYKSTITDLGMKLVATHCGYFTHEQAPQMIEAAKLSGVDYLIIPYTPDGIRKNIDGYKAVAENFNKIGEKCNAAGLKFGYHNHAFEFEPMEGQIPQEVLISETQANLVTFEADLFWTVKGNYDPIKLIEKFPGRISLVHVKDMNAEGGEATVGQGRIDFKSIFAAAKKSGLVHYFIEDERTDDPIRNIKADHDYIIAQDFA